MLFPLPPPPPLPLFPSPKIWVPYQESKPLTLPYPKGEPTPLTFPLPRIQAPTPHPPLPQRQLGGGEGESCFGLLQATPLTPPSCQRGRGGNTPYPPPQRGVAYPSKLPTPKGRGRQLGGGKGEATWRRRGGTGGKG